MRSVVVSMTNGKTIVTPLDNQESLDKIAESLQNYKFTRIGGLIVQSATVELVSITNESPESISIDADHLYVGTDSSGYKFNSKGECYE